MPKDFPHWCCDGHEPVGFANGPSEEMESCPVCLLREALEEIARSDEPKAANIARQYLEISKPEQF